VIVTSCPARVSEVASARPTLPAPMMAICMAGSSWNLRSA
jgi:hypothetical protein